MGAPCVVGAPCIVGSPCIVGAPCTLGAPCVVSAPCIVDAPFIVGAPYIVGDPCIVGSHCVVGTQQTNKQTNDHLLLASNHPGASHQTARSLTESVSPLTTFSHCLPSSSLSPYTAIS